MSSTLVPEAKGSVIGDNEAPDYAQQVTDRMADEYAALATAATALLDRARSLPETVADEDAVKQFSDVVVDMRNKVAQAEAVRIAEKEPFLRGGQAVDGFFNTLKERLDKGIKVLSKRVNDYQQQKLVAERERRRLEAEAAAREEREKQEAARKLAKEAEEKRLEADRARKPEIIEEKTAIAAQAEQAASTAAAEAALATNKADDTHIETLRKPAEIARSRFDSGRLVTMRQVPFVEIEDRSKLNWELLKPFFKDEHVLQALKGWAKTTSHKQPMAGAVIEMRDDTVIR